MAPSKEYYSTVEAVFAASFWGACADSENEYIFYCEVRIPGKVKLFGVVETDPNIIGAGKIMMPVKLPTKRALRKVNKYPTEGPFKLLNAAIANQEILDSKTKSPSQILQELGLIEMPAKVKERGRSEDRAVSVHVKPVPVNNVGEFTFTYESNREGFGFLVIERKVADPWRQELEITLPLSMAGIYKEIANSVDNLDISVIAEEGFFADIEKRRRQIDPKK